MPQLVTARYRVPFARTGDADTGEMFCPSCAHILIADPSPDGAPGRPGHYDGSVSSEVRAYLEACGFAEVDDSVLEARAEGAEQYCTSLGCDRCGRTIAEVTDDTWCACGDGCYAGDCGSCDDEYNDGSEVSDADADYYRSSGCRCEHCVAGEEYAREARERA